MESVTDLGERVEEMMSTKQSDKRYIKEPPMTLFIY